VLIENLGSSYGTLQVQQSGNAGPSTSFGYVGKLAFDRWLTSSQGTAMSWLRANRAAGYELRQHPSFPGNLLHGIWDYSLPAA